jgi:hypothetical protein
MKKKILSLFKNTSEYFLVKVKRGEGGFLHFPLVLKRVFLYVTCRRLKE